MKIAISQQDIAVPSRAWPGDALERAWHIFLRKHQLIPVPNTGNLPDWLDCDAVILSGGPFSVYRTLTEVALIRHALDKNIPLIGICHGAFVVNEFLGGVNDSIDGHNGTVHDIEMEGHIHEVNSYHGMNIARLAPELEVLASCAETTEAFAHPTKPIWGVVWHPERQIQPVLPKRLRKSLL